jgi:DNA-binding NtrC family response regulator
LASAYGIIQNHNGIITVYSEIGLGTTFNIYLPISDKEVDQEAVQNNEMIKGTETILLVDDEEMIVDVAQGMLERLGYRVVAAGGGSEALKKVEDLGDKIDLVILDLIMPEMDGEKTFQRICEVWPGMPVILSSGYAINSKAKELLQQGCKGFIQKPFTIYELSGKIRKVLDEA